MTDEERPFSYKDAGVDIDEGARAVERIREHVRSTMRPEVLSDIGGFGGLFSAAFEGMDEPVLVSGADGVGTKIEIAKALGVHGTVGVDLVAMCANDILVSGAEPLFFLDYIACGKVEAERIEAIVAGIAEGCRRAGCALLGGETAEHPGVMAPDDYDLSGFCVGVVDRARIVDGSDVEPGDVVLGLASSGLHSNGFSLVRKVLVEGREEELDLPHTELGGQRLGEALLAPTRIYVKPVLAALGEARVKAMAHITGGGITENLPRSLPEGLGARVWRDAWRVPGIFGVVQREARLDDAEMLRTFNMGVGFALVLSPKEAPNAAAALREAGETVFEMGEVVEGEGVEYV
ncbi:MAG: phosphoribosylformylglycinamidine cyclo-ligase [Coriobacteriia bacterium]